MAEIQYTGTQNEVRTAPTNYNVQPNQTAARGFANVSKILQGGVQLKGMMDESNYRKQLTQQENDFTKFSESLQGKTFPVQQELLKNFERNNANKYVAGEDRYSQDLNARYNKFSSTTRGSFADAQYKIDQNDALIGQNAAFLGAAQTLTNSNNTDEMYLQLEVFKEDFVSRYEGIEDPNAQALYDKGLTGYSKLEEIYMKKVSAQADNKTLASIAGEIQTDIETNNGIISEKGYKSVLEKVSSLSGYAENSTAMKNSIDQTISNGVVGYVLDPAIPLSFDKVKNAEAALANLGELSPFVRDKSYFQAAQRSVAQLRGQAKSVASEDIYAMLSDDGVKGQAFGAALADAQANGVFSKATVDALTFRKKGALLEGNQRTEIGSYIMNGDIETLIAKSGSGELNTNTITSMVDDNLTAMFKHVQGQYGTSEAVTAVLNNRAKFTEGGFDLGKLPFIDEIANLPDSGDFFNPEDVGLFLSTVEAAKRTGYVLSNKQNANYNVLKMMKLGGIPNIQDVWNTAKNNPTPVKKSDVKEAFYTMVNAEPWFGRNLTESNLLALSTTYQPMIETIMKAGINVSEALSNGKDMVDANYIRVDGEGGKMLIPLTKAMPTPALYEGLQKAFKKSSGGNFISFAPVDPFEPEGDWAVLTTDDYVIVPTEKRAELAKTKDTDGFLRSVFFPPVPDPSATPEELNVIGLTKNSMDRYGRNFGDNSPMPLEVIENVVDTTENLVEAFKVLACMNTPLSSDGTIPATILPSTTQEHLEVIASVSKQSQHAAIMQVLNSDAKGKVGLEEEATMLASLPEGGVEGLKAVIKGSTQEKLYLEKLAIIAQETETYTYNASDFTGKTMFSSGVAERYGLTLEELKALNPQIKNLSQISDTQEFIVPTQAAIKATSTLRKTQARNKVKVDVDSGYESFITELNKPENKDLKLIISGEGNKLVEEAATTAATRSSAKGFFQIIGDVWRSSFRLAYPNTEYTDEEILSFQSKPMVQLKVARALTEYNKGVIRTVTGAEPTDGLVYATHLLGGPDFTIMYNAFKSNSSKTLAVAVEDKILSEGLVDKLDTNNIPSTWTFENVFKYLDKVGTKGLVEGQELRAKINADIAAKKDDE